MIAGVHTASRGGPLALACALALLLAGCRCGVDETDDDSEAGAPAVAPGPPPSPYGERELRPRRTLVIADAAQLDDPGLDLSTIESLDLAMSELDGQERPLPLTDDGIDDAGGSANNSASPGSDDGAGDGDTGSDDGDTGSSDDGPPLPAAVGPARPNPRCEGLDLHALAERAPKLQALRISGCQAAIHAGLSAFGPRLEVLELVDIDLDAVTVARLSQLHGLRSLTLTRVSALPEALKPLGRKITPESLTLRELGKNSPVIEIVTILRELRSLRIEGPWADHQTMILIGKAKTIEELAIIDTEIGNYSLHQIKGLSALHRLEWRGPGFNDVSPQYLRDLPIDELICNCPRFGDRGLHMLRLLPKLRLLELERSDISSAGLAELVELPGLEDITIRFRDLDGSAFAALATLPRLRRLILGPGKLLDPKAAGLSMLVNLHELELDLEGFDDRSARELAPLVNLERLLLGGTAISDEGLEHLAGMTQLQVLELHHTRVTKHGLQHLAGMSRLERLELDHTDLVDEGVAHLAGLRGLRELRLDHTLITDAALPHLLGLRRLERLNLAETVVTAEGVKVLEGLPELESVNLSGTRALGE